MHAAVDDRIDGVDEYRAAGRVLADDRTLRSAQHLDVGDVVIGLALDVAGEGRHAIAISDDAGGGLRVVLGLADAADVEVVALAEIVDHHARRCELQRVDVGDALVLERVAADHRCRNRGGHQVLTAALGCDDDRVVTLGARILRRLILRGNRAAPRQRERGRAEPKCISFHGPLPGLLLSRLCACHAMCALNSLDIQC